MKAKTFFVRKENQTNQTIVIKDDGEKRVTYTTQENKVIYGRPTDFYGPYIEFLEDMLYSEIRTYKNPLTGETEEIIRIL